MDTNCPYTYCPKCKSSNSWVRDKTKDVISQEPGEILWKGWQCKYCGDATLAPTKLITGRVSKSRWR